MGKSKKHNKKKTQQAPVVVAEGGLMGASSRRRNLPVFAIVAVLWLVLDLTTKSYFNQFELGEVVGGPFLGLIQFKLVHNIGAAWGIFGGAVVPLAVLSLFVCVMMSAYLFYMAPQSSLLTTFGTALIVAGGLGNAIDRLTLGYVVDFIETVFMEFPVFNIADIGVTCGFALFFIGMMFEMKKQ